MIARRITYLLLFICFTWLALATRRHADWFHPFIARYAGDTIWAGMFLFILRIIFPAANLVVLAFFNYAFGVLDELSQLWRTPWLDAIRDTTIGRLMLGVGFVWSDLLCYAVGTFLAYWCIIVLERLIPAAPQKSDN